jgi:hypothetical protein
MLETELPLRTQLRLMPDLVLVLILMFGGFLHLFKTTGGFSAFPGDTDARFNQVILEHVYQWISGNAPLLFSPQFFYPFKGALNFSDNHFGSVLFYIVGRSLGAPREIAFIAWFIVGYCLTFIASAVAFRKFGFSVVAIVVGAFIFTFNIPMFAQDMHAQLVYRFGIPLAVLALATYRQSRKNKDLFLVAIWTGLQFFSSIYLGVFLVLLLFALIVSDYLIERVYPEAASLRISIGAQQTNLTPLFLGLAAAAIWIALLAMFYGYYKTGRIYAFHRPFSEISSMLPRPSSFLLADESSIFSRLGAVAKTGIPMRWEHQLFPGAVALILAVYAIVSGFSSTERRRRILTALFAGSSLILLTMQISGWSLYYPLTLLPATNAIRSVTRIVLVVMFPLAVLAAFGVEAISAKRQKVRTCLLAATTLLLVFEVSTYRNYPTAIGETEARISRLTEGLDIPTLRKQKRVILWLHNPQNPDWMDSLDAMYLAQDEGLATFNGLSSNFPPVDYQPTECSEAAKMLAQIATAKVGMVDAPSYESLLRQTLMLPTGKCGDLANFPFRPVAGGLPDTLPANVLLTIIAVEKRDVNNLLKIRITNDSDVMIPAISSSGNPVNLSWRFTSDPTARISDSEWSKRRGLSADILPHSSHDETFTVEMSVSNSPVHLQVSLIQEGVMWFHEHGMAIAVATIPP